MRTGFRVLIAILASSCCARVHIPGAAPTNFALVMRFGAAARVVEEPGLHFKWPPPVDGIVMLDRRIRVLDPEPNEFLTRDKKNVIVASFMAWSIEDPLKYLRTVSGIEGAEARLTRRPALDGRRRALVAIRSPISCRPRRARRASPTWAGGSRQLAAAKAGDNFGVKVVRCA